VISTPVCQVYVGSFGTSTMSEDGVGWKWKTPSSSDQAL
jgi:hypothetical protein